MKSFMTDDNNDLMLDSRGYLYIGVDAEAYRQIIVNRIKLQQYEYPYNLERGINWLGYVLGVQTNLNIWEAQILNLVNKISFVNKISDWKYDVKGNNLEFRLIVDTDSGVIDIKG